jgi:ceramide glucosyltransferase
VIAHQLLGSLALLSLLLLFWQWWVARRFLSQAMVVGRGFTPRVTVLKPLKGLDEHTEDCLRSWLQQEYPAPLQLLFCVGDDDDPVIELVESLLAEFPAVNAKLLVCTEWPGANAKVCKLRRMMNDAMHEILVISDADTHVPTGFVGEVVQELEDDRIGMVSCLYSVSRQSNAPMWWEAIGVNADFWSQVLQSNSLRRMDFALGAVMVTRRSLLQKTGGFDELIHYLADDYELGRRISSAGHELRLSPLVVECRDGKFGWRHAWEHQLRWARTIRFCQPFPYFLSILNNTTLWLGLWCFAPVAPEPSIIQAGLLLRLLVAANLQRELTGSNRHVPWLWLVWIRDLLTVLTWALAFVGDRVVWRTEEFRVRRGGLLAKIERD